MTIAGVVENQGKLGSLRLIGKPRTPFTCRECEKDFEAGKSCYAQSDSRGPGFFPVQTKVCMECGQKQIDGGAKVKEKKSKKKKVVSNVGCGEDTVYPKPDGSGEMWKCGDKVNMFGVMLCDKCKALEA